MRATAAVAMLVLLPLVAASAAPATSAPPAGFSWEAPPGATGPLALDLAFDLGAPQACTLVVRTAGTTRASPVLAWEEVAGRAGPFYSTNNAQVHLGAADTRTLHGKGGAWAMESTYEQTWGGILPVTVVVPQAGAWENANTGHHPALRVDLQCARDAALVSASSGREAVAFTADSMKGGAGANLNALIFVEATLTRGDGLDATFASPQVELRTYFQTYGSPVEGTLALAAPSGERAWDVTAGDARHADGPGAYALTLDYTAAGTGDTFVGVLFGTAPGLGLDAA